MTTAALRTASRGRRIADPRHRDLVTHTALPALAAAAAIGLGASGAAVAAPDSCVVDAEVATCSGDQSAGIRSGADFDAGAVRSLIVWDLTVDIAPTDGQPGIRFVSTEGDVDIWSEPGAFGITTTGDAAGIHGAIAALSTVQQEQLVVQINVAETEGATAIASGSSAAAADQIEQSNENIQSGSIADHAAGDVEIHHSGDIRAAGTGIVGSIDFDQTVSQGQGAEQTNTADMGGSTAQALGPDLAAAAAQSVVQSNANRQELLVGGLTIGGVAIDNAGDIIAGADGLSARVASDLFLTQDQMVEQLNDATQGGALATASAEDAASALADRIEQSNGNVQEAVVGSVSSGAVRIGHVGEIDAEGDGIAARSELRATISQDQTLRQSNAAVQEAGTEVEAESGGAVAAAQSIEQSNENVQRATVDGLSAGSVGIQSSGRIVAGGHGIVGVVEAAAEITQTQDVEQDNAAAQGEGSILAGGAGSLASALAGVDQSNLNGQEAAIGDVLAGGVDIVSNGTIIAGGDGIVAASRASAQITQVQSVQLTSSVAQDAWTITAVDGGEVAVAQEIGQSNMNLQSAEWGDVVAGDVAVRSVGGILAGGRGIVAQSVASGAAATAGTVTIEVDGNVTAGAEGVLAESAADDRLGADIQLTILDGAVMGGDGFFGVALGGGAANTITNSGVIGSLSGQAIRAGAGDETVWNFGTIVGDVDLGGGTNAFFNEEQGWFLTGDLLDLGGGVLTNAGRLAPGGAGAIVTTTIDGDFVNAPSGRWLVDLDMAAGTADRLDISGTATVSGEVVPVILVPATSSELVIASAAGGTTDAGLTVGADTLLIAHRLSFPNAQDVVLTSTIDMRSTEGGLNENQAAIGQHLNLILAGGAPAALADLYDALLALDDLGTLAAAYDQLGPGIHLDAALTGLLSGLGFSSDLMSCSARGGGLAIIRQDQCAWARLSAQDLSIARTSEGTGFDQRSIALSGGVQREVAADWHLGFGLGYERGWIEGSTGAESDVDRLHAGVALKHTQGPWYLAAALAGSYGWHDTTRPIALPGLGITATSTHDIWTVTGRLRGAYLVDLGASHLKPRLDVTVSHVGSGGFSEGGGAEALTIGRIDETVFGVAPALEWGAEFEAGDGLALRPYLSVGATILSSDEILVDAGFVGAPGVKPFRAARGIDRVMADVAVGVEMFGVGTGSLRLDYSGRFSDTLEAHAVGLRASVPF